MDLGDLLSAEEVIPTLKAKSKKHVLQEIAGIAGEKIGLDQRDIFDVLLQRERLGSTGVGHGIAIPHGRLASIDRIYCLFARLDDPIDFDSIDDEPVDLVFLLLAPETAGADHLKALARISRLIRESQTLDKLRGSRERSALYSVLTETSASHAA
ncbi:MAG: PTS IIA-like nitrogen-regulatory protein PtsN [Rhodomicrobium sp.]|nr:MAG: PTS IIA-like nitrogen-regulatory protein PtsN [Rhodomicrobium sp.]